MPKVWCAQIECRHNAGNRCKAPEINLSAGRVHTVHQGFKQIWECRSFEMSDSAKELYDRMKELTMEGG